MLPPKHAQGGDPSPWVSRRATPGRSFLNAPAEVREVGTAHGTARGLVYLLDRPAAPVWTAVGVQQAALRGDERTAFDEDIRDQHLRGNGLCIFTRRALKLPDGLYFSSR
jgi:hypothetical protein